MATRSFNKQVLEAREKDLLNEIKYFEKRIEEAKNTKRYPCYDSDSSDSELEFKIENPSTVTDLRRQNEMLKTCFQATQELTDVVVVQSVVNLLPEDPIIEGEPPVQEQGVWKQVMADCRIDLVPFSITFYVHQPERAFGPLSYRGLQVLPVKKAHEVELNKSVLATLRRPSHAIEVIRSFAVAHRSRRTTLANLAEKYADSLFMEPKADGGYILKCANILEISWTLQNKTHIAPFHHKMKFDLEYMDESYIKIITHAHRQLSDPTVDTNERTLLLAKIINTCLEAQKPTQELHESLQSDPESLDKLRPKALYMENMEIEEIDKDAKIMAPPKSVPKSKIKKITEKKSENNDPNKRESGKKLDNGPSNVNKMVSDKAKKNTDDQKIVNKAKIMPKNSKNLSEKHSQNVLKDKFEKITQKNPPKASENEGKNSRVTENKEPLKQNTVLNKIPKKLTDGSKKMIETTKKVADSKISQNNISKDAKLKKTALPVPLLKNKFVSSEKVKIDNKLNSNKRMSTTKIPEPLTKKKSLPVPIKKISVNKVQKVSEKQSISKNIPKLGLQAARVKK